jgi:CBS domain-containing protein
MSQKCSGVMTSDPTCCVPGDTVQEAARLMKSEDVGPIPVVDDREGRKLVGMITDRDIAVNVVAEGLDPKTTKVEAVMTRDLVTVGPDDDVQKAFDLMSERQVRRLPVVESDGRIVGIIAQADVATRLEAPRETAKVVEGISQP